MKNRVLSAIFIVLLTIVAVYFGDYLFKIALSFIGLYGAYEIVKMLKNKMDFKLYIPIAFSFLFIIFTDVDKLSILIIELLVLFILSILDDEVLFKDISVVITLTCLIGLSLAYAIKIQEINKWMLGYVIVNCYITDVFAFFVGLKFGKHKLIERISPKKTIEGAIGGWLFGFIISFLWARFFNFFDYSSSIFLISSLILPIISQIGDLIFSSIKRTYGIKDFSNLIPGHGGILDRFDSNIVSILFFGVLLSLI